MSEPPARANPASKTSESNHSQQQVVAPGDPQQQHQQQQQQQQPQQPTTSKNDVISFFQRQRLNRSVPTTTTTTATNTAHTATSTTTTTSNSNSTNNTVATTHRSSTASRYTSHNSVVSNERTMHEEMSQSLTRNPYIKNLMTQVLRDSVTSLPTISPDASVIMHSQEQGQLLPPRHPLDRRNVLVLDLDETLVHSSLTAGAPHDLCIACSVDGRDLPVYVRMRPFCIEFLEAMAPLFEVVIFTASLPNYADPLIDQLDPERKLCHHRLYREHCTNINGSYVKDLSRFQRSIEKIAIVDNSPVAYLLHPRNSIPCTTWRDNANDRELADFIPMLKQLATAPAVFDILDQFHQLLASP